MLKEYVRICERDLVKNTLKVKENETVSMKTYLDEIGWEVYTQHKKKWYVLQQQGIYFKFIVSGELITLDNEVITRLT